MDTICRGSGRASPLPSTTYNLNNPGAFGRFTGTVGDFSNFGTAQANVQMNFRAEF